MSYLLKVRIQTLLKFKIAGAMPTADDRFVLLSFICPGFGTVSDYCESSFNSVSAIEFPYTVGVVQKYPLLDHLCCL